jgi:hypothetical protein
VNPGPAFDEYVEILMLTCLSKVDANAHYNGTLPSSQDAKCFGSLTA